MIDDFSGGHLPPRKTSKTIDPLPQPETVPLPASEDTDAAVEPNFIPPEKLAGTLGQAAIPHESPVPPTTTSKKHALAFTSWQWPLGKKATIIAASVVGVLLIGGITAFALSRPKPPVNNPVSKKPVYVAPAPIVIYSNLTGLPVADASVNQRPVTGVMIENSIDARPESGLNQAGVVFEAIAEGGITRFLALFQDSQPDYIGPVRSVRPYYLQWCMGYDCSIAHVGGSPEGLADIKSWGAKDLDQFYNAGAYQRITTRYAPHNVYTSMAQLNQVEAANGYGASSYTGFSRKADVPSKTPNASSIDFAISSYDYNVHFDYVAATDSYTRSEGGAAHMELNKDGSKTQITPKVVVAMVMQYGLEADGHHSQYNVVGSGQAYIFQDGTVTAATWSKTDTKAPLTLQDAAGKDIALNRGQTWLTAVSAANQVTYK